VAIRRSGCDRVDPDLERSGRRDVVEARRDGGADPFGQLRVGVQRRVDGGRDGAPGQGGRVVDPADAPRGGLDGRGDGATGGPGGRLGRVPSGGGAAGQREHGGPTGYDGRDDQHDTDDGKRTGGDEYRRSGPGQGRGGGGRRGERDDRGLPEQHLHA